MAAVGVRLLRGFSTRWGPWQTGRYGMVIPIFVRQALAGSPITVYGSGRQSRSATCPSPLKSADSAFILRMVAP